jgi:hypothetical protein
MMIDFAGRIATFHQDGSEAGHTSTAASVTSFADEMETTSTSMALTSTTSTTTSSTTSVHGSLPEPSLQIEPSRLRVAKSLSAEVEPRSSIPMVAQKMHRQSESRGTCLASEIEDLSLLAKVSRSSSSKIHVDANDRPRLGPSSGEDPKTSLKAPSTVERLLGSLRDHGVQHGADLRSVLLDDGVNVDPLGRSPIKGAATTSGLRELSMMVAELQTIVSAHPTTLLHDGDGSAGGIDATMWKRAEQSRGPGRSRDESEFDELTPISDFEHIDVASDDADGGAVPCVEAGAEGERVSAVDASVSNGLAWLSSRDPAMRATETKPLGESLRTTVDHLRSLLPEGGRLLEVRSNFVRLELSHTAGPLQIEVMVRSGVVDVRAHGLGAAEMAWRVPELAAALQGTGMRLGAFEVQSVRRAKDTASSGGGHTESRQKSDAPMGKTARKASSAGARRAG